MGLKSFFKKVWHGVKKGALKVGKFIGKVAKPVVKVGKFISKGLSHLPGAIGTVAGVVNKGLNVADGVINSLPESKAKQKLQEVSNSVNGVANTTASKVADLAERAKKYSPAVDMITGGAEKVAAKLS